MTPFSTRTIAARLAAALLLVVGLVAQAAAQGQATLAALDAYIARAQREFNVPGLAVAIVKDDTVVLAKGYGVRELGRPDPVDEHTIFGIASNTKAFTAAAVATLVDAGTLSWDDKVSAHLPDFQLRDPLATLDMRVRDLLCHRSGLGTFSGDVLWYGSTFDRAEVVRRARYLRTASPFRSRYGYSNVMFVAAGEVVAAVTGKSWDAYVKETFFDPLGMRETVTSVRDLAGRANVATPHAEPTGTLRPYPWQSWDNAAAAGSIATSVSDLARWIRLQLGRGTLDGRTYFSEGASRTMWTPHTPQAVSRESEARFPSTHFRAYGLGWGLADYRGRLIVSHGGAIDGMFSGVTLVPEERLGLVVLTNSTTSVADAIRYRVLDAYLGGDERDWIKEYLALAERGRAAKRKQADAVEKARVPGTKPSFALEAYAGAYGGASFGNARVSVEGGGLVIRFEANPNFDADLVHWHYDVFEIRFRKPSPWWGDGKAQFLMDNRGRVSEITLDVPNDDFWFDEIELKRIDGDRRP
jgi:CubicO group peptidase (beta-lactamase class C family)